MKNMYLMTTAVIALCTATSMASAQSVSSGDDLWTGGFVGVGGSFLDVSGDLGFGGDTEGGSDWTGDFWTEGVGGEGVAIGSGTFGFIEVGADQQTNQVVFGGFASYDFGNADATATFEDSWESECCSYEGPTPASLTATISVGDNWTIGGRAGYLAGPRTLLYGMVGLSSAQMSASVNHTLDGFFEGEGDLNVVGYDSGVMSVSGNTFGAGIEHMFLNNWSMKLEYRSTVYDGSDLSGGSPFEGTNFGDGETYGGEFEGGVGLGDITTSSMRASVNYRF